MESLTHQFDLIDDRMAEVLRSKTEADRLAIAHGLWRSAGSILRSMLHANHPDWSDEQVRHEVARRLSHGAV
jgi:hypothetical protein